MDVRKKNINEEAGEIMKKGKTYIRNGIKGLFWGYSKNSPRLTRKKINFKEKGEGCIIKINIIFTC